MINLTNLCAGYGAAEKLHDITLGFATGKITAIVGPNGCGKSTLLRVISGLLPFTAGSVTLAQKPLQQYSHQELAKTLAFLPQSRNVPRISVRRMVLHGRFPYLDYPRRYRPKDYEAVEAAIARVGIETLATCSMEALSGGERQKVYLAMALAQGTPIVLLDEPTTFLDVRHQLDVIALIGALRAEGKTVIPVLHDLNLALRCADTLVVMDAGNIAAVGTPNEIVQSGTLDEVFGVRTQIYTVDEGQLQYAFVRKT